VRRTTKLGRQVALKVLPMGNTSSEEAIERFRREARTASSLNHPNICTIYGFDEHENQLYLAMELLDGEPLDRRLSGRPLDLRLMLDIAAQVADALDAAHAEGILHRDVKPGNIFLTRRGPVKVLDFGLAKLSPEYRKSGGTSTRVMRRVRPNTSRASPAPPSARSRTCPPSRRAATTSIRAPTCSRSASCCTRWRRAARVSPATPPRWCSTAFSIAIPRRRARSTRC
jgi:serine/threonine protein kinase